MYMATYGLMMLLGIMLYTYCCYMCNFLGMLHMLAIVPIAAYNNFNLLKNYIL